MDNEETGPPPYAGMALGITSQDWGRLGLGEDPSVAASNDLALTVERITSLILFRIVAWIQPRGTFTDLSTTTICRQVLVQNSSWPGSITHEVMEQLKTYVNHILSEYQKVPYHNFEHCYHVTISTNKLLDMILHPNPNLEEKRPPTYGLRDDPLMQFALVFAALIHDVEHQGIPNRQLANEDDVLAVQYNDTSIAEHRSLYLGFSELLKPKYMLLRNAIFPEKEDYRRFRTAVVNLVLNTDIASPERSQLGKSKWKEAFGDPYETVERKVRQYMERRGSGRVATPAKGPSPKRASRRMSTQSIMSELTLSSPVDIEEEVLEDDTSVSDTPDSSEAEDNDDADANADTTQAQIASLPLNDSGPIFRPPKSKDIYGYGSSSPAQGTMRKIRRRGGGDLANDGLNASFSLPLDASAHSVGGGNLAGMALKFHRRLSSIGPSNSGRNSMYRNTRLGLLRTVDLSGQTIQTYHQSTPRQSATGAITSGASIPFQKLLPAEEVNELQEAVVMETILKAADVAHNLQGWDQMAKWSNRLFLELRRAYVQGRGDDPQNGWFTNQIGFLEAYLLPLARRLDDTGVFGDTQGAMFAQLVEENRDQWTREGMLLTAQIILEGDRMFPGEDTDDEL